jgi:prolyl 4-hydroxylase
MLIFFAHPFKKMEEPCKIMEGFLEPDKCQYLIDSFSDRCKRSTVVDANGKDVIDANRTSSTYFMPSEDPVVTELRRKAAATAGVPESHVEGLQLVRYAKGEQYKFHYDYFDAIRHNQREHTFLVYLNDFEVHEGGSTIFKLYGIKVYPRTGRCVWFRDMIDGKENAKSLHAGEEVLSDKVKYAVNIWIREKPVDDYSAITIPTLPTYSPPFFASLLFQIIVAIVLGIVGFVVYYGITKGRLPSLPSLPSLKSLGFRG